MNRTVAGDAISVEAVKASSLKVVIALNTAWNIVNFRSDLIRALVRNGYQVTAVAPIDAYAGHLSALGCRYVPLPMRNHGARPWEELALLWRFYKLLRAERPAVYLGYTVKPNVYGSMAAHALGIPVINNVSGLGSALIAGGPLQRLVLGLYRLAFSRSGKVFFQNEDDRAFFESTRIVDPAVTDRLPGSGVDLQRFAYVPLPHRPCMRFVLIARMLWDKGVQEFVDAARLLRQKNPDAQFLLVGFLDVANPTAIPRAQVERWVAEGVVQYAGAADDVRPYIEASDCVVLPSYREGLSRVLLEAAAMGRPVIATDVPGCRDVVDDGVSGLLCRARDSAHLAEKMQQMIDLTAADRAEMGWRGRQKIERQFDQQVVIDKYLQAVDALHSKAHK